MNSTKQIRKALRSRIREAILSVLPADQGIDSGQAAKAVRKMARKLAKQLTPSADRTHKAAPAKESATSVIPASPGNNGQEKVRKKKEKAGKSSGLTAKVKSPSRPVS
jgi:hypothetical protein